MPRPRPRPRFRAPESILALEPVPPTEPSSTLKISPTSYADLATWQLNVRLETPTEDTIYISAETPAAAAQTIIKATEMRAPYTRPGRVYSFQVDAGVEIYRDVTPQAWLSSLRQLKL